MSPVFAICCSAFFSPFSSLSILATMSTSSMPAAIAHALHFTLDVSAMIVPYTFIGSLLTESLADSSELPQGQQHRITKTRRELRDRHDFAVEVARSFVGCSSGSFSLS